ncbi:Adenylate cyclase activation protein git1 [Madurella mycetomatis]|uniref:Adenylate cyclase activation protein git1 n=1 Tax=Madurella mycetomatis TaxID=100816 RepID=A0A175W376_9PEZI|nr:Adenylate cyclase activation protein git1 [Madurella mycetomatis]
MSSASRSSYHPNRRVGSVQSIQDDRRPTRVASRARAPTVSYDDAYSFALRIAFLRYLLQPRKKRKEYVSNPKPPPRAHTHTSSMSELMKELVPSGSASMKLPSGFSKALERRMSGVLQGIEKLPGYSDAAVKRTFAEAYTAFTAKDFQKSIEKDRKVEPLVLIFYSSATKAQGRGKPAEDHSWKLLVDRHLAMFIRLLSSILRDKGDAELVFRLNTLEKKLLSNDQNLYLDTGQEDHSYVEVEIPLSYEIKDMPMVLLVAKIFGVTNSQVQADIDRNMSSWTEEAALKDYKAYQFRLSAGMAGTIRKQDFDLDEAFEEWRRQEGPCLAKIFAEILSIRPDLKSGPSMYDDQAYAELSRMLSSSESPITSFDPSSSYGSLSLEETASIRSVDEPSYTFIPTDPRSVYKVILQYVLSYDQLHSDTSSSPLSEETTGLLIELAVRWRIPQFSRYVAFVEVAVRKFLDQELSPEQLYNCLDLVKEPLPEPKNPPPIQMYTSSLRDIEPSRWTMVDFASYQQSLKELHDALLRDLFNLLMRCYELKPPTIGVVMALLMDHVYTDAVFSQRPEDEAEFTQQLENGLRQQAANVYREYLDANIPRSQQDWDFGHVVNLGKAVVSLAERIKKRYRKSPEIMGVSPYKVVVETTLPSFEEDCHEIIKRVLATADERGVEIALDDGFELYRELVEIRTIHVGSLPGKPFAFHIEGLLEGFVWRWIKNAEDKVIGYVENAIKHDPFNVRTRNPDDIPTDEERHSSSIVDMFQLFTQTAEQLSRLQWADEVHLARFMTAISKVFAAGIGRYCEIVEQQFAKEMDRQTAQEVAAASKTTQERLFQYAKDAWNTKEKIEPFQFYPQSFVKFNNIEWAMQELDKLEKIMTVDRWAEILRRVDGPKQLSRKPAYYVFTVKVVEGEELKACDPGGTSDPYVVLCDEYQKRLAKTRVIPRTLNPRWDESVDITVSGPLNIIATIWDYDMFGDHDFVGRTSLKLDPVHFSDYLPREFWLDLDTQGRLLIRVSMEGERDDIQFHFGKAFRHLKRTERDMVRKVTSKLSMHINTSLSHEALRGLLSKGITASMASLWKKRQSTAPTVTPAEVENALRPLFTYFDENFAIMKQTLTDATMMAVMTRLWKEVLIAIENLLVPPLSDKPSTQKPLTQAEMDVVYRWLELLFAFFNAKDESGEVLGVPADVLKSPKWHELASLNFFYFDPTETLIRTSERMAAANAERSKQQAQQQMQGSVAAASNNNRLSAPATLGVPSFGPAGAVAFGSLGTIRRGKSIMMSRNLGTMRRAKEEKRKEAQADPSDDMILRILRMRPEAASYLKERQRQKERMAAAQAAAMIVRQSVHQGWNSGPAFGGALYGRNHLPQR